METKFNLAIAAIDKKKLDKAKQELQEGKKHLAERQKLIKLANQSECGWATVAAYVTDDLADTPDNERRISKAEKSAKKASEAKREKSRSRSTNLKSNNFAPSSNYFHSRSSTDSSFQSFQKHFQFWQVTFFPVNFGRAKTGVCFVCGLEGHWRNSRPFTRSDKSSK